MNGNFSHSGYTCSRPRKQLTENAESLSGEKLKGI
jgi:hypothetical protein